MPRITRVYTRTGDAGETGLGTGARVPKISPRIAAFGSVDELNSYVGTVVAGAPATELRPVLQRIQNELFHVGAELCVPEADKPTQPGPRIEVRHVAALEQLMDELSEHLTPLENFILPGGTPAAAALHVCRSVCRRAERDVLVLAAQEPVSATLLAYLNRLSDALFVMARYENQRSGISDPLWNSRA